jgi:hypothetical protein
VTAIPKDLRPIVKVCRRQGLSIAFTTKNHLQILRDGQIIATHGGSPSDHRAIKNFRADLRRAGVIGL